MSSAKDFLTEVISAVSTCQDNIICIDDVPVSGRYDRVSVAVQCPTIELWCIDGPLNTPFNELHILMRHLDHHQTLITARSCPDLDPSLPLLAPHLQCTMH